MVKSTRSRRAGAAASAAFTLVASVAAPAHASPVQDAYAAHTAACIGLFFRDADAHAAQCLPNTMPNPTGASTGSGFMPPPAIVPPPPPVVVVAPPPPPVVVVAPPPPPPVVVEEEDDEDDDSSYPNVA